MISKSFTLGRPLPLKASKALVFSNRASESTHLGAVREACRRTGLTLDVIGSDSGNLCERPQDVLGQYDIVFAKGRCALEALAVGAAVVICDELGAGPMVTVGEVERLLRLNFGVRLLQEPVDPAVLEKEVSRYDSEDATEVSRRIRASVGRDGAIDQIVELYHRVVDEFKDSNGWDRNAEARAEALYLRRLVMDFERERDALLNSGTFQLRNRLLHIPIVGSLARSLARKFS